MGLLSKYRNKKSLGHSRTNTSSSSIVGSEFSTSTSDSSHTSSETHNFDNSIKQKNGYINPLSNQKSSPKSMQSTGVSMVADALSRKQPPSPPIESKIPGNNHTNSTRYDNTTSPYSNTLAPAKTSNISPPMLNSPKVRAPKTAFHSKNSSFSKSPLGRRSTLSGEDFDNSMRTLSNSTFIEKQNSNFRDSYANPENPSELTGSDFYYNYPKKNSDSEDMLSKIFDVSNDAKHQRSESTDTSDDSHKHSIKSGTISQSMSELSLNPQFRYISDYDKYFFEGTDDEVDYKDDTEKSNDLNHTQQSNQPPAPLAQETSLNTAKQYTSNPNTTVSSAPPAVTRVESNGSSSSYNSIERGDSGKFRVSTTEERIQRIQSMTSKTTEQHRMKQASQSNSNPSQATQFTPIQPQHTLPKSQSVTQIPRLANMHSRRASMSTISNYRLYEDANYAGSIGDFNQYPTRTGAKAHTSFEQPMTPTPYSNQQFSNFSTEYIGASKRHTMMAPDRRSMYMPYNYPPMGFMPPMVPQSRSTSPVRQPAAQNLDPNIIKKIENFVTLRTIIAQGNKSLEYRLKWVQMLISSINAKLYMYISIKGEPVPTEAIEQQRHLYIKSAINHILRLLRECDGKEEHEEIFSDVCYIYGCLLKNDYVEMYQQDFNIQKNVNEALRYFQRSVEVRSNNFKSYYRLGELYEDEFYPTIQPREGEEDFLETALKYYKQSAQYGYNKAIYRISLLYLNYPQFRSPKCIKYLGDLANVDTTSKDINLEEEDSDELDHVIGNAAYQMGRFYEGLYPGDLTIESEFVTKCLEIAPVNWNKALSYYNKAARLNCLLAQVRLGKVYENGELDRQPNVSKSIQWYFKASNSTNPAERHFEAMLGLSRWFMKGSNGLNRIIPYPDPQKALLWCDRALESNDPEAYFARGVLAEQGLGTEEPESFFQVAYEMGHIEAGKRLNYQESDQDFDDGEIELEANDSYKYDLQEEFKI